MIGKLLHRVWCVLTGRYRIYGKIGVHNRFGSNTSIHENTTIGNYNYIGANSMIFHAQIGNYNSIAPGVKIGQVEHDLNCVSTSTYIFGPSHGITTFTGMKEATVIENDVWIGANSVILQGVTVGTGAVVGAGAVVTKNVPPYSIVVGVPAKIVRYRFDEERIKLIIDSRWWDNDHHKAVEICKELQKKIGV